MFVAQHGKCAISKEPLTLGNIVVHHITPRRSGGGDNYENLILVSPDVHQLIHATDDETVRKYPDMIPDRVCVADARNHLSSVIEYAPDSEPAQAYQAVCEAFLKEVEDYDVRSA